MKCYIYVRQSSGASDPDDSLSLSVQEEQCRDLAASKGMTVLKVFRDANTSGRLYPTGYEEISRHDLVYLKWTAETKKTGQTRAAMGKLLQSIEDVDAVIVYDITRFFRPLTGSFLANVMSQALQSAKVKLISFKEGEIDFSKFQDSLITSLTSQIASEQLRIQTAKSKAAMKRRKDAGEWSTEVFKSFGYKTTGRKCEVEVDQFKAKIVKLAYDLYNRGESFYHIGIKLNKLYYAEKQTYLSKVFIVRILKNSVYCGLMKNSSGELIKAKPLEGKEIISFSDWKKAQERFAERKIHPRRARIHWLPISGRVVCGECGSHINAITTNKTFVDYRCMSYLKQGLSGEFSCKTHVLFSSDKKLYGGDYLKEALTGLMPMWWLHRLQESDRSGSSKAEDAELMMLNLKKRQEALTAAFMEGDVPEDIFQPTMKSLKKKLQECQMKLDEAKSSSIDRYTAMQLLIDLGRLDDEDIDEAELEEGMRWIVKQVTVFRDHVTVTTPEGDIQLPVNRVGHGHLLPRHVIAVGEDKAVDVIYYYREFRDAEDRWKTLLQSGKLRIMLEA